VIGNYRLDGWNSEGSNKGGFNFKQNDEDFKKRFTFDLGYRFTYNKYFSSLSFQRYTGRINYEFANKEGRQFDLYMNTVAWGFGMHLGKPTNKFSVSPFINMVIGGKTRVVSQYIYADGFHSYGSEINLNGTYANGPTLGEELGLLFKYNITKKMSIELELSNMWANLVAPSTLDDPSLYKAFSFAFLNPAYTIGGSDKVSATKMMFGLSYTFSNKMNGTWYL
jgi:hypothetical protein